MIKANPHYYCIRLEQPEALNQALLVGYSRHVNDGMSRSTHFYEGRYENVTISADNIPEINQILQQACGAAAEILNANIQTLRAGLWFNAMPPGSKTLKHAHDDDDELLSAVYYVHVPENSGKLLLHSGSFCTQVTPEPGLFVFFPPDVPHEVSENCSTELRLSLGINIGPVDRPD